MTAINISGAGFTGTLRLTWLTDNLARITEHAGTDEPSGTWTSLACPDQGLAIGSDVDLGTLKHVIGQGEIAGLIWEAPGEISRRHNQAFHAAMDAYEAGNMQVAEQHWRNLEAIWSQAWSANYATLDFMQQAGIASFAPVKPQRWVIASFEHHCGQHGIELPHVHNIVITSLTTKAQILDGTCLQINRSR